LFLHQDIGTFGGWQQPGTNGLAQWRIVDVAKHQHQQDGQTNDLSKTQMNQKTARKTSLKDLVPLAVSFTRAAVGWIPNIRHPPSLSHEAMKSPTRLVRISSHQTSTKLSPLAPFGCHWNIRRIQYSYHLIGLCIDTYTAA
jgi:hypothetical protein